MQINGPGHIHGPQPINAPHGVKNSPAATPSKSVSSTDEVQISAEGNFLSQVSELPEIRSERVAEIQQAIANGTYETEEKFSRALDALLDEIA